MYSRSPHNQNPINETYYSEQPLTHYQIPAMHEEKPILNFSDTLVFSEPGMELRQDHFYVPEFRGTHELSC